MQADIRLSDLHSSSAWDGTGKLGGECVTLVPLPLSWPVSGEKCVHPLSVLLTNDRDSLLCEYISLNMVLTFLRSETLLGCGPIDPGLRTLPFGSGSIVKLVVTLVPQS
jgi:hypothetical protein